MQNENDMSGAEREFENALRGLKPLASPIDAVDCAFEAGFRSARGAIWRWRAVASVLVVAISAMFVWKRSETVPPKGAIAQAPTVEHFTIAMEPRDAAYPRLRESVLDQGLDALVIPKHSPARAEPIPRAGEINWRSS